MQSEIETANSERDKANEQVDEMKAQVAQLPILAEQKALTILEKESQHEVEKQKIRKRHNDELIAVQTKYNDLSKAYRDL